MSSEQLADGVNPLDAELAATWDVLKGYSGRDTDLGIARRFGGAAAAYSLRNIGSDGLPVVRVRREPYDTNTPSFDIDDETQFSAHQVQSGVLEDWVNGKLENILPADNNKFFAIDFTITNSNVLGGGEQTLRMVSVGFSEGFPFYKNFQTNGDEYRCQYSQSETKWKFIKIPSGGSSSTLAVSNTETTDILSVTWANTTISIVSATAAAAAYSLRKVNSSYSGDAVRIRRSSDDIEVDVAFDSDGKVSSSSAITNVAEEGGESGQTTDTTLGDFISGTDAFVHTWYDQAGSNDAVQATAANQPKIAESGALLADGLLFDGSNDSFEATDITDVNFPATVVSVSETNSTGVNRALYSLNNDSNACCGFYRSTNKYAINNGTTTLAGSATYTTDVHRLKFDLFNGASSAGFSNAVSDISGDIGTQVSQVTHFRIAGSLKTGITNPHSGTIKEIILYTSDQSNNRFKIESNINNYYGLYNDANELSAAFDSNGTITGESKDGFTADVAAFSHYVNATFNNSVATGETIYVSFNAQLAPNGGTAASPIVRLQDAQVGSNTSNQSSISEGFNSIVLTATGTSDRVGFLEQDDDVDYIISDFKVSRIARNGFVETWYDQSGNGEDMTQVTAGKQPSIVINGGQVKDYNGNNSIDFVSGSTRVLDKSGTTTAKTCIVVLDEDSSGSSERAILGFSDSTSFMRLDTALDLEVKAGGVTANYRAVPTDVTSLYFWYTNGTDEDKLFANNVEEGDTTSNTPPNLPFTRIGARNSDANPYNSRITEIIAFAEDLSSDRTVLQDDVNNNYNIF